MTKRKLEDFILKDEMGKDLEVELDPWDEVIKAMKKIGNIFGSLFDGKKET